jgi:pimeloyl-ACP methyl ester carboxylesterase
MIFELIGTKLATLEVMRTSDGQPNIVILPGGAGGIRDYADLCQKLKNLGLSAVGINLRTCGASTGSLQGITFQDMATDVIEVIKVVTERPVLLAGHAGGNRIARMVATLRPDLVSGVILIAAGGKVPPEPDAWAALGRLGDATLTDAERRKVIQTALFSANSEVPDTLFAQGDVSPDFVQAFGAAANAAVEEEWWAGGSATMLVIQGKEDRIAPVANGHLLREKYPERVRVHDLDDAGHMLFVEKPEEISQLIAAFAEEIDATS